MKGKYAQFDWSAVGLDFGNWEEEKIWALELPVVEIPITELLWHFGVPFWTNDAGERWAVSPEDVMRGDEGTSDELRRVRAADMQYPIDVFQNRNRLLILDGIHRLARAHMEGKYTVRVRIIPPERFIEIASAHPIELPS